MKDFLIIFVLVGIGLAGSVKVSYRNYKVYNVVPNTEEQVQMLIDLSKENLYDFWSERFGVGTEVRIMVSPKNEIEFRSYAAEKGLNANIGVNDVQELIDAQMKPAKSANRNVVGDFSFTTYHELDVIYSWLDQLVELYPGVVTAINIGSSFEGRPIRGIKIDYNAESRVGSPLIAIIEGGIHAREWIAPATVTGIINEFLTSTEPSVRRLAEAFQWHIIPVMNPDGYLYTFSTNRLWRKNRNTSYNTTCNEGNDYSNGVDLNRNFDFYWLTIGASSNPCDETFAGPSAFSEPESRALSNYVLAQKQLGQVLYYFAIHSYSQMVLIPYSHVIGEDKLQVDNYGDLFEIAIRGVDKLTEKHGTPYLVGTSTDILYSISGGSYDWMKGVAEIPITMLIELRDLGQYGFLLPADQIIPNNEEIMEWLLEADRVTRQLNYYESIDPIVDSSASTLLSSFILMVSTLGVMIY